MDHELRLIPGFDGRYSVTEEGQVWSVHQNRWLKPCRHGQGYLHVNLKTADGKSNFLVHRLVAWAWVVNPDPKKFRCVNHKDGNKQFNHASNLEWCDHAANNQHAVDIGLRKTSQKQIENARKIGISTRSLSDDQVRSIRSRWKSGESVSGIARDLGIKRTTASAVVHGYHYSSIV